jgi:Multimeric flavodoxin WrbA
MGKNIVVITGSPRKKGNSFAMTQAFIEAAQARGHSVTRFDAAFLAVDGCRACETCYKTGKACTFDDDFNTIAPAVVDADAVVFSMPVYWYTMPGKIKNVIDKLYSLVIGGKGMNEKECGLLACCEDSDMTAFDGVRIPYEKSIALLNWKSIGHVLIPSVLNAGDIERTDGCRMAAELADLF